jgi:hypothetical protein
MIWLRYAFALAAILVTGRIHSKHLDEQGLTPKDISMNAGDAIDRLRAVFLVQPARDRTDG